MLPAKVRKLSNNQRQWLCCLFCGGYTQLPPPATPIILDTRSKMNSGNTQNTIATSTDPCHACRVLRLLQHATLSLWGQSSAAHIQPASQLLSQHLTWCLQPPLEPHRHNTCAPAHRPATTDTTMGYQRKYAYVCMYKEHRTPSPTALPSASSCAATSAACACASCARAWSSSAAESASEDSSEETLVLSASRTCVQIAHSGSHIPFDLKIHLARWSDHAMESCKPCVTGTPLQTS